MPYTRDQVYNAVKYYIDLRSIKNIIIEVEDSEELIEYFTSGLVEIIWPMMNKFHSIFDNKPEIASKAGLARKVAGACLLYCGIKGPSSKTSIEDNLKKFIKKTAVLVSDQISQSSDNIYDYMLNMISNGMIDPDEEIG